MAAEALLRAIEAGDSDALHRQLDDGLKAVVNTPLRGGLYGVHVAAQRGDVHVLETLLHAGGNVNQESEEVGTHLGWTAAHYAAYRDDATLLRVLVSYKADFRRRAADGWSPLHVAAFKGSMAALRVLLEPAGADVNATTNLSQTPLVFAVNYGRLDCVRLLLKSGADVAVCDAHGDTLLHHALHYQLAKLFEGAYEVPEAQLDIAVTLALAGAPATTTNADDRLATYYVRDELPSLQAALELLSTHATALTGRGGSTAASSSSSMREFNYLTLCATPVDAFVALGVPASAAAQLHATLQQLDLERVAVAQQRLDKTASPSHKAATAAIAAAAADDDTQHATAHDQAATAAALPAGHPAMSPDAALRALRSGDDPSGGKCPFFQRKSRPSPPQGTAATAGRGQSKHDDSEDAMRTGGSSSSNGIRDEDKPLCPFSIAFVQRHRTTLLCVGIAFVLGMWTDQVLARLLGLH